MYSEVVNADTYTSLKVESIRYLAVDLTALPSSLFVALISRGYRYVTQNAQKVE